MGVHSGQITQLIQGVSQQHPKDRAEGQIGEQRNCISDIVDGLRRRPGIKVLSELVDIDVDFTLDDNTVVYSYARGDGVEEYVILVDYLGRIKIYNAVTGAECTVTPSPLATSTVDYLKYDATVSRAAALRFHTIADTTFILNTRMKPAMAAVTSAAEPNEAIVYCTKASYGHEYFITIKWNDGTDRTATASIISPSHVAIAGTEVAKQSTLNSTVLMEYLTIGGGPAGTPVTTGWTDTSGTMTAVTDLTTTLAAIGSGSTFTLTRRGDILVIENSTYEFSVEVTDGSHGNDLKAIRHSVMAFEELPKATIPGYKIEVKGTGDERYDNYWVEWNPDNDTDWYGPGVWEECCGFGLQTTIDTDTMPLKLTRTSTVDEFLLEGETWGTRGAGDDDTNPLPSFIGNYVRDMGSCQNRFYFLSEENIIMSRPFVENSFFAESVASPADDDPIDSASSDNQVTNLLHSALFDGSLVLFSNNAQFIHPKDTALTPSTFGLSPSTKFNVSPNVKPVVTGTSIMFPTDFGEYTNVWEYNLNTQTGAPECESTTKHIPRYIEGNPVQMVANTTTDFVFMRTDANNRDIYVNQFYVKDDKKAQLAWHKWSVPNVDKVTSMTLINQRLFLVTERNSKIYLEYVDLSLPLTENSNFEIFLDQHYSGGVTYGPFDISVIDTPAVPAPADIGVTWDPLNKSGYITLTSGDLSFIHNHTAPAKAAVVATEGRDTGKFYFEVNVDTADPDASVGVCDGSITLSDFIGAAADGWGFKADGYFWNGSGSLVTTTFTTGDIIMVAVDIDAGKIWFGKNGTWIGVSGDTPDPGTGVDPAYSNITGTVYPAASISYITSGMTGKFNTASMTYDIPTDFLAWGYGAAAVIEDVKSVVFDFADNHGATYTGMRAIDFYASAVKIALADADITATAGSYYDPSTYPKNAFITAQSKTGSGANTTWHTSSGTTAVRLIVTFGTVRTFDSIRVNNYHHSGGLTERGGNNVKIYMSKETITNLDFDGPVEGGVKIFDGTFDEHIASDVEDEKIYAISTQSPGSVPATYKTVTYESKIAEAESGIPVFVQGIGCPNEGFLIEPQIQSDGFAYVNVPDGAYIIQGYRFFSGGTLTNPYVKDRNDRPYTKKTIIDEVTLNLQRTAYLDFIVEHAAGENYTEAFNGMILNNWQWLLGEASELSADLYVPIRDYRELVTMKFESDHHLGFALMSLDWIARMQSRGRRSQ